MDVRKPAKQNGSGVIFIVSGGFKSGIDLVDSGPFVPVVAKPFLDRGYTLFAVCHGAQPKFIVSEIVPDIHRGALHSVHANDHGVDPDRLGIMGGSSGGCDGRRPWPRVEIDPLEPQSTGVPQWDTMARWCWSFCADAPDFAAYRPGEASDRARRDHDSGLSGMYAGPHRESKGGRHRGRFLERLAATDVVAAVNAGVSAATAREGFRPADASVTEECGSLCSPEVAAGR